MQKQFFFFLFSLKSFHINDIRLILQLLSGKNNRIEKICRAKSTMKSYSLLNNFIEHINVAVNLLKIWTHKCSLQHLCVLICAIRTAIKRHKIKEHNNAWISDRFSVAQAWRRRWHWKVWRLSVTFVLQTVLCQGGDCSGEQNKNKTKIRGRSGYTILGRKYH